jgi:hypothetical protein
MISPDELVDALDAIENVMYGMDFRERLQQLDEGTRQRVVELREQMCLLKTKLQTARLNDIAANLERYEDDLRTGMTDMEEEVQKLANTTKFLNGLDKVVSVGIKMFGTLA